MTYTEEQLILKRIDELEKSQKEQDELLNRLRNMLTLNTPLR